MHSYSDDFDMNHKIINDCQILVVFFHLFKHNTQCEWFNTDCYFTVNYVLNLPFASFIAKYH